jgi:hypothetical protein
VGPRLQLDRRGAHLPFFGAEAYGLQVIGEQMVKLNSRNVEMGG